MVSSARLVSSAGWVEADPLFSRRLLFRRGTEEERIHHGWNDQERHQQSSDHSQKHPYPVRGSTQHARGELRASLSFFTSPGLSLSRADLESHFILDSTLSPSVLLSQSSKPCPPMRTGSKLSFTTRRRLFTRFVLPFLSLGPEQLFADPSATYFLLQQMAQLKSLAVYFDTDVGTIAGKTREETLANFLNLVSLNHSALRPSFF